MKFTLGKKERLKSKKLIEQLYAEGKSIKVFPFRMVFLQVQHTSDFPCQVGFSVPKRNFKLAVSRNRIKRLMRETYRLQKNIVYDKGNSPKFIDPMFNEATSGCHVAAGRTRSSMLIVGAPPVVMLITQSLRCLIVCKKGKNACGVWSGRPSLGLRACRCTTAAPALAAPMAASAISLALTGRCGDIDGVWMAPVTAQVIITLRGLGMRLSSGVCCSVGQTGPSP